MSDIDKILEHYDYAETFTTTVANGMLEVTVAEAHHRRNREFGQAMLSIMARDDVQSITDITEDLEIDICCDTLLKGWSMTRNDKPVPISEAREIFKRDRAGSLLFREIGAVASTADNFLKKPSKKKPSSGSTRTSAPRTAKRSRSRPKPKSAAARSRNGSANTSNA